MNWLSIGAGLMALAVAAGAFGAHGLASRVSEADLATWHTAALYHMIHALALVALGASGRLEGSPAAGWLLLSGVLIFSGSLYALVLSQQRWLGAVTPIGGLAFIAAWILIAVLRDFQAWSEGRTCPALWPRPPAPGWRCLGR